ncbi:MAG: hypothetical protein ACE5OR_08210 [bacterium]
MKANKAKLFGRIDQIISHGVKRTVALKFLPPQALGSEEVKTRFIHEAQASATLELLNINGVYEIHEPKSERQGRIGPLPIDETIDIAMQGAECLQEVYEKGIVHRDIKSTNILAGQSRNRTLRISISDDQGISGKNIR